MRAMQPLFGKVYSKMGCNSGYTGAAAHGAAAKRAALVAWACSSIPPEGRKLQVQCPLV